MNAQSELWTEELRSGYRLNKHLLAAGEKPDMRPWGGRFDKTYAAESAVSLKEEV